MVCVFCFHKPTESEAEHKGGFARSVSKSLLVKKLSRLVVVLIEDIILENIEANNRIGIPRRVDAVNVPCGAKVVGFDSCSVLIDCLY